MIDPKAEPIGHRPPYKPIDVSGRKPVQDKPVDSLFGYRKPGDPGTFEWWVEHFNRIDSMLNHAHRPHRNL